MNTNQIESMVKRILSDIVQKDETQNNKGLSDNAENTKTDVAVIKPIHNITLDFANLVIKEVIKKAAEIGVKAVCAVCDSGARPVSVQSADGAFIASYDIAVGKAYTSVSLKMKTSCLKELASPGGSLYGIQNTNGGKIVIFGGGVPLKIGDEIIGGFGVSGGSAEQDTYLGEYAEDVFYRIARDCGFAV